MKISTQAAIGAVASHAAAFAVAVVAADPSASHGASIADCPPVFQSRLASLEAETAMYKNYLSSGDDCQAEISHVAGKMEAMETALEERESALRSDMEEMTSIRDEAVMKDVEIEQLKAKLEHEIFVRKSAVRQADVLKKTVKHLKDSKVSMEQTIVAKYEEERRRRISRERQAEALTEQLEKSRPLRPSVHKPREVTRDGVSQQSSSAAPNVNPRFSVGEHVEYSVFEGGIDAAYPAIVMESFDADLGFNPSYRLQNMATAQCVAAIVESEIARYLPHEPGMEVMCKSCTQCNFSWWPCRVLEFVPVPHQGVAFGSYIVQNLETAEEVRVSNMWTKWVGDMDMDAEADADGEQDTSSEEVVDDHGTFNIGDHVEYRQDSLDEDIISLRPASVIGGPFEGSVQDSQEDEEGTTYHLVTFDDNTVHKGVSADRVALLAPHAVGDIIHCTKSSFYLSSEDRASLRVKSNEEFVPCQVEGYYSHPHKTLIAFGTYDVRNLINDKRARVMVRTTRDILDMAQSAGSVPPFAPRADFTGAPTLTTAPTIFPTLATTHEEYRLFADGDCVGDEACVDDSITVLSSPIES